MRLAAPENRKCRQCGTSFITNWPQRLCNPCKYCRAARGSCAKCGKKVGHSRNKICWECRVGPTPTLNDMSSSDLAWLTGLIEGEGYFGIVRGRGIVRVVMTDADIIERLKTVSGTGTVNLFHP